MINITEQVKTIKNKKTCNVVYIPVIAFLLGSPLAIVSSYLINGKSSDFASLNQAITKLTFGVFNIQDVAAWVETHTNSGDHTNSSYDCSSGNGTVQINGADAWRGNDGSYSASDCDCQCHNDHSNHSNYTDCASNVGGGGDCSSGDDDDDGGGDSC